MLDKENLNKLYRYALSLTKHEDQAYDLLHTSLEKFLSMSRSDITCVDRYLMRMIRNQFIDEQRKRQRHLALVEDTTHDIELEGVDLHDLYIRQEQVDQLLTLLDSQESELLFLWAVEERSVQEIADLLNVPKGTLLSRLHRLKGRLRKALVQLNEAGEEVG